MLARRLVPPPPFAFALIALLFSPATAPLSAEESLPAPAPPAAEAAAAAPETAPTTTPAAPTAPVTATPATPAAPAKRPRIAVAETTQDAGQVRKGKKVEVEFTLANQGDAPLQIKDADPSCGCTVASFDKQIAPGATGKVRALVDTSNFDGPIAKHVTVLSNDPDTPRVLLTIKADVLAFVRALPSYARILQVQSQESTPATVTLWSTDDKPLDIRTVDSPEPWISATARRATAEERLPDVAAEQWRLEVALGPDAPVGPLSGSLEVHTGHPEEPVLEIPLSGTVRRVLHVQPGSADFGTVVLPLTTPRRLALTVHNFGKEAVELRSVASDLPFVTAKISPEEAGRRFKLELWLSPDAPKGSFEGHLKIESTSAVMPLVEVPFRGKVK